MASAQDVRRRIVTVMTPVANIVAAQGAGGALTTRARMAPHPFGNFNHAAGAIINSRPGHRGAMEVESGL